MCTLAAKTQTDILHQRKHQRPPQKIMQKHYNRSYHLVLARAYTKTIKRKVNERAFDSKFHAINCQLMARTHPSQAFKINQISKHMKVIATKEAIRNRGASRWRSALHANPWGQPKRFFGLTLTCFFMPGLRKIKSRSTPPTTMKVYTSQRKEQSATVAPWPQKNQISQNVPHNHQTIIEVNRTNKKKQKN